MPQPTIEIADYYLCGCYLCGCRLPKDQLEDLSDGRVDPDTGYTDEMLVCATCMEELADD